MIFMSFESQYATSYK